MKNNKSILLILTIILGLGISLASVYFMYTYRDSRENKLGSGLISIDYQDGETINITSSVPVIDDIGIENPPYEFSIKNTSSIPVNVSIKLDVIQTENMMKYGAVRYALYINDEFIKKDYVHKNDLTLYTYENLYVNATIKCKLVFWVDYYYDEPGLTFKAKVVAQGESFDIIDEQYDFDYTGGPQTFVVPVSGTYKIELWGAQGGGAYYDYGQFIDYNLGYEKIGNYIEGGNGGYVSGNIYLTKNLNLVINVGGIGNDYSSVNYPGRPSGGYNGGGLGGYAYQIAAGGGGATDVRLVNGNWDDFNSLKSRIIVAGAGGGTSNYRYTVSGGSGGGLNGYGGKLNEYLNEHQLASGGTQTEGGISGNKANTVASFGKGADSHIGHGGGGGSGYYGGGGGGVDSDTVSSGAGGSSFISGHNGCDAIAETSTLDNIIHTGQSIHYSKYKFTDTIMIDGEGCKWTNEKNEDCSGQLQPDGTIKTGHNGNGYARITYLGSS